MSESEHAMTNSSRTKAMLYTYWWFHFLSTVPVSASHRHTRCHPYRVQCISHRMNAPAMSLPQGDHTMHLNQGNSGIAGGSAITPMGMGSSNGRSSAEKDRPRGGCKH